MIPSDHFVRFYNEAFKFLDERDGLRGFYDEISHHQDMHCLALFKAKGLQGMYDYWNRIRIEENCDMTMKLFPDRLVMIMNKCPSLSKAINNDAGPCPKYCNHCPGWVIPLLERAGYITEYNLVGMDDPRCVEIIRPKSSGRVSRVFMAPYDEDGNPIE